LGSAETKIEMCPGYQYLLLLVVSFFLCVSLPVPIVG